MVQNKKNIISLIWVVFTDSLGWGIAFSVFAALFFNAHSQFLSLNISNNMRYMIYEFALAIYSVFMFFFAPVIGGISDHYGRKPGLKISMLGLTFGFILCSFGCYRSNLWILILGRAISGMTAGSFSVAQAAAIDISTNQTKPFYLSMLSLANCVGFSVGPILGAIIVQKWSLPIGTVTFLIGAIMSVLGFLSIVYFFDETHVKNTSQFNILKDFSNIRIAFSKPWLNVFLLVLLFSMVAYGLLFSYVPVFLYRQFLTNNSSTGSVLSVLVLSLSISLIFCGKYVFPYFKKIKIVFFVQLIQVLIYATLSIYINSFLLNILFFAIISFLVGVMYIGLVTLISDITDESWQGRVMGVIASISSITWGIGPVLTAILSNFGIKAAFFCSAILMAISLFMLRFVTAKKQTDFIVQNIS